METKTLVLIVQLTLITSISGAQNLVWGHSFGGNTWDNCAAIASDANGNVYTTGTFEGTIDFDPGVGTYDLTTTSFGQQNIYAAKYAANGDFIWAKLLGGTWVNNLFLDINNHVFIGGQGSGGDFDPGPGTFTLSSSSGFVVELDKDGNFIHAFGSGGVVYGIVTDGTGNIYTTGPYNGSADFDPGPGTYTLNWAGQYDIFICKTDSLGNFDWAKGIGGGTYDFGNSIALDAAANICITGGFSGTVDFDPGPGTTTLLASPTNYYSGFVLKLNSGGNFTWVKQVGNIGRSILCDGNSNIYTGGNFFGTTDFDPGPGAYNLIADSSDVFISKLAANGNFIWAKKMGGLNNDYCSSIELDGLGNIYSVGSFGGTADFDPGSGTSILTGSGAFVAVLTGAGNFAMAFGINGALASGCNVGSTGHIHVCGSFSGNVDLDPSPAVSTHTSMGKEDMFVLKLTNPLVGITEQPLENITSLIYPNPSSGSFYITLPTSEISYCIYDAMGRCVFSGKAESSNNLFCIEPTNVKEGVYSLCIEANHLKYSQKMCVVR